MAAERREAAAEKREAIRFQNAQDDRAAKIAAEKRTAIEFQNAQDDRAAKKAAERREGS
jgi:hypothetical protein